MLTVWGILIFVGGGALVVYGLTLMVKRVERIIVWKRWQKNKHQIIKERQEREEFWEKTQEYLSSGKIRLTDKQRKILMGCAAFAAVGFVGFLIGHQWRRRR